MSEAVTVLVVDDVKENLIAVATLLKQSGIHSLLARSGTDALEALLANDVALALIDVQMPGMDGFELAELMRGSERTRSVPIIFLTAGTPERTRIFKGYEAGAVDFLFKPFDPQLLESKVGVFAELHRQKRELGSQLERIQQAQRMSDLFVAVLGHDLRNPLSSISSSAQMIEQNPRDVEGTLRKVDIIRRASQRMDRLIQQVLDFAVMRVKGGIPVKAVPADFAKIVKQAMAELDEPSNGRLRLEVEGDTRGCWDPDRLLQAIANLIGNSLQHGEPATEVSIVVNGSAADEVRIEVHNQGSIDSQVVQHLFAPFKPHTKKSSGLGLGLYIVDQIVRAHGGTVVLKPEAAGITFQARLPRRVK